jgi:hypothetical protein
MATERKDAMVYEAPKVTERVSIEGLLEYLPPGSDLN